MKDYLPLKEEVTKIINGIDPWDLISAGAPSDEYDGYVNGIVSLIVNHKYSIENLEEKLAGLEKIDVVKIYNATKELNSKYD